MVAASLQVSTLQMCIADVSAMVCQMFPQSDIAWCQWMRILQCFISLLHFVSFPWRKHEADLRQEMRREHLCVLVFLRHISPHITSHYNSPHIKSKARSRRSHCSAQGSLLVRRVRRRLWRTSSWKSSVMNWSWRLNPWRLPKKRSKWRGLRPPWNFEACCTWKLFCGFLRKGIELYRAASQCFSRKRLRPAG